MKFRVYLYAVVRILFGGFLALHSAYNVIIYSEFLNEVDTYFTKTTVFKYDLVEALAPLVPFEEFVLGLFLILGYFTRKVLICASILFLFLALFLLDVNSIGLSILHIGLFILTLILWKKDNYNLKSMDYSRDMYLMI
ncbi:DoxX family membrane protein [Aquimarina sp. MMG015]|uniref:DoxX family membrane protein n=1 Tax=Aquimarina TaxID=290174 RepID=UPI00041617AA|nr:MULTISPECIES: DoxX family membrane protein [Aquimarina]MBQ4805713.1 DoxX family membrane protein [Aquimarina sp. MMG015]